MQRVTETRKRKVSAYKKNWAAGVSSGLAKEFKNETIEIPKKMQGV